MPDYVSLSHLMTDDQANKHGKELELIRSLFGNIEPETIDNWATNNPDSMTFKWCKLHETEESRAFLFSVESARLLMRTIGLTVEMPNGISENVRAFVHVEKNNSGREYTPILEANDNELKDLANQAYKELQGWSKRYRQYAMIRNNPELLTLVNQIDHVLKETA